MIKAVIFDMDGLMFDTERLAVPTWQRISRELGYEMPAEFVINMFGRNVSAISADIKKTFGEEFDTELGWKLRKQYVTEWIDKHGVPLKPGLKELLKYIRQKGLKTAIATSTDLHLVEHYLNLSGLTDYYDGIVTGQMVAQGKPAPDIYQKAARVINVNPKDCLALEDAPAGIRSAKAAGMQVIMVPDMVEPTKELKNIMTKECQSLHEVISFIEET